jgi:hypothetical protein
LLVLRLLHVVRLLQPFRFRRFFSYLLRFRPFFSCLLCFCKIVRLAVVGWRVGYGHALRRRSAGVGGSRVERRIVGLTVRIGPPRRWVALVVHAGSSSPRTGG